MTLRTLLRPCLSLLLLCSPVFAAVQYQPRQDVATSLTHLAGTAVADFNGDGAPDIAVAGLAQNQIMVYLNDGHGHFSSPMVTSLPPSGYVGLGPLVSGDVNEDGKQDLIVSPVGGLQYDIVLLGNGDGTFTVGQVLQSTYGFINAKLVDLNGDKHLDLIYGGNGTLGVLLGDGKGAFAAQNLLASGIGFNTGLALGVFNANKPLGLVTSTYNTDALQYFSGNGDGSFGASTTFAKQSLSSLGADLVTADFNGDGKLDLAVGDAYAAYIIFGNGDGTFDTKQADEIGLSLAYVDVPVFDAVSDVVLAAVDLDGNGTPDIAAVDDNAHLLNVLLNSGKGYLFATSPDLTAPLDPGSNEINTADLNADGLPDLIVSNYKTGKLSIFLSVIVKTQAAIAIQSSTAQALTGSSPTVTVQVTGSSAHPPTGSVSLASGTLSFGQMTLNGSGAASFPLPSLSTGQYPLTAVYAGDNYNTTVTSDAFQQSITDFQVALPTSSQSIPVGGSASYPLTLSPQAGFGGTVTATCSGLPAGYSCAPLTATLSGQPLTATLIVSPPSTSAAAERSAGHVGTISFAFAGLTLLFLRRPARGLPAALLLLCVVCLVSTGCGGSAKSTAYTGTSSFVITATATQGSLSVSHQTSATLTVHP